MQLTLALVAEGIQAWFSSSNPKPVVCLSMEISYTEFTVGLSNFLNEAQFPMHGNWVPFSDDQNYCY
jgi:hypothetical protein